MKYISKIAATPGIPAVMPAASIVAMTTVAGQTMPVPGIQRLPQHPFIQRAPIGKIPPVPATLDRAAFEQIMRREFGVKTITTGTQATQESILSGLTISGWQSWAPDEAADEYQQIVDAFRDFRRVFGATPVVSVITFFEKRYDVKNGAVVADDKTGAQFGVTDLTIFKRATTMPVPLPLDRSNVQGKYGPAPPGALGMGYKGSPKAAPLIVPGTHAETFKRAVVHELGHGLASAAMNLPNPASSVDPKMMQDYKKAVGWTDFVPAANGKPAVSEKLFDSKLGKEITRANWNDPEWGEQPVSEYSLDGPGEDFAESVMAFVYNPQVLQKRSPARHKFIDQGRQKWLPRMFTLPPRRPRPFQSPAPEMNDAPDIPAFHHYA